MMMTIMVRMMTMTNRESIYVKTERKIYIKLKIIMRSTKFKCSLDHAKKSFYRSANGIFGKVGRIASEEVVLQH